MVLPIGGPGRCEGEQDRAEQQPEQSELTGHPRAGSDYHWDEVLRTCEQVYRRAFQQYGRSMPAEVATAP